MEQKPPTVRFLCLPVFTTFVSDDPRVAELIRDSMKLLEPKRFFMPNYKNWLRAQQQLKLPPQQRQFIHPRDQWDGYYKFCVGSRFPTGLLHIATGLLDRMEVEYSIKKNYIEPEPTKDITLKGFTPRDYQLEAIQDALRMKRATICIPTNGGKTEVIFAILKAFQPHQFTYVVHLKNLLTQTRERMRERLGVDPGVVGDGICDIREVGNIVMFQSMTDKVIDRLKDVPVLVIDEVHHTTARDWYKKATMLQAPVRFGLSATPLSDEVYADWKLKAVCGPIIERMTNKEMIERGFSCKPVIHIHSINLPQFVPPPELGKTAGYQRLIEFLVGNEQRNGIIAGIVRSYRGKSRLVMVHRKEHGRILKELIPGSEFISGEDPSDIRDEALNRFKSGSLKVLISTLFGEGTDISNIEVLVFAYPISFDRPLLQRIGRGLRMEEGKEEVHIIDFKDTCSAYLDKALEQRLEVYRDEGFQVEFAAKEEEDSPFV